MIDANAGIFCTTFDQMIPALTLGGCIVVCVLRGRSVGSLFICSWSGDCSHSFPNGGFIIWLFVSFTVPIFSHPLFEVEVRKVPTNR